MAGPATAGPEPCVDGSSHTLGPGAAYASLARPVNRARSLSCFSDIWLTGPGADRIGSSRLPGPEPYLSQWLVPFLRAFSCIDRLDSSRQPGPEPPRPLWLIPFSGPGADRIGSSRHPGPTPFRPRDGDYADPHASEESPWIMTRRRGRRARHLAPLRPSSGWWRRRGGANGGQQKRRQAVSERPLRRCVTVHIAGGCQPSQRQRSQWPTGGVTSHCQWDVTPSPSPRLKTAHALEASLARRTSHLHPCIAPIAPSRA